MTSIMWDAACCHSCRSTPHCCSSSSNPDCPRAPVFTLAVTVLTAIIFGLVPAFRASGPDPWNTLKDTAGSIAGSSVYSCAARVDPLVALRAE
jgi:hypothetical protein